MTRRVSSGSPPKNDTSGWSARGAITFVLTGLRMTGVPEQGLQRRIVTPLSGDRAPAAASRKNF
ncbi:hypothetical protein ACWDVX_41510 [Streptomyces tendae]